MISDICAEAMDELDACQQDYPDKYHSLRVEINNVRLVLDSLRLYLDSLPRPGAPQYDAARQRLKNALAELDVSVLLLAANQMWANYHDNPETSDERQSDALPARKKKGGSQYPREDDPTARPADEEGAVHVKHAA